MDNFQDAQMSTENEEQEELPRKTKRQHDWMRKCISNFSLYTHILVDRAADHVDVGTINVGDFKKKLSKSTKKRLRRQKKKRLALSTKSASTQTTKKVSNNQVVKKQKRKDLKRIIKGIAQI